MVDQLRTVATKQGWTVVKAVVDQPEAGRTQRATLSQMLATSEADLLIVRWSQKIGQVFKVYSAG